MEANTNTIQSTITAAQAEQSEATQAIEATQAQAEQSNAEQAEAELTFVNLSDGTEQPTTFKFPKLPEWTAAEEMGYTPITTFWQDFSIADRFGMDAVLNTYCNATREWHHDVKYMTELALVLNHKGWAYYNASIEAGGSGEAAAAIRAEALKTLSGLYFSMFRAVDDYCRDNFEGEDAEYYWRHTD